MHPSPRRLVALALMLAAVSMVLAPPPASAQTVRTPRVGDLSLGTPTSPYQEAFATAFRALGYIDGQTVRVEYRHARGNGDRLAPLAAELVRAGVIPTCNSLRNVGLSEYTSLSARRAS